MKQYQNYEARVMMVDECWVPEPKLSGMCCEECGAEIYDGDADTYTDPKGRVYCCLECAMEHVGLSPFDWYAYYHQDY